MAENTNVPNVTAPVPTDPFGDDIAHAMASGMSVAEAAFLENCGAVQSYSTSLMALSQAVEERSQAMADYWINTVMNGPYDKTKDHDDQSDMGKIQWDKDHYSGTDLSNALQEDSPLFTEHNTEYNQCSSFFSGLDNGINQNSSDTTQTLQLDLTMYQSGPLSQQQILTQAI